MLSTNGMYSLHTCALKPCKSAPIYEREYEPARKHMSLLMRQAHIVRYKPDHIKIVTAPQFDHVFSLDKKKIFI